MSKSKIVVLGESVQGLIAATLCAKSGMDVHLAGFRNKDYETFANGYKTGPVIHVPFPLSYAVIDTLGLESHGLDITSYPTVNPFKSMPFYDGLNHLCHAFASLDENRPSYREKAWRDTWATFELGRVLAGYDADIQNLFAQSTTLSLNALMDATGLPQADQAQLVALCVMGSRTDPASAGSAAAILPAIHAYKDGACHIHGGLHDLLKSLKQAAMAYGVNFTEGQYIDRIDIEDGIIRSVHLDGGEDCSGDYYILDHDPVAFFEDYGDQASLPPAFRNRVTPAQNMRESVHIRLGLSSLPDGLQDHCIIAPDKEYINTARHDCKHDGGSQFPVMSVINITGQNPHFAPEGHYVLDILSHYFDLSLPGKEDSAEAQILVTIQALDRFFPGIADMIVHSDAAPMNTQAGQPNFSGSMPLLQLFKIFFGHHSIGYDAPYHNLLIAGYGNEACTHYHVNNGGMRVANLLQSLKESAT